MHRDTDTTHKTRTAARKVAYGAEQGRTGPAADLLREAAPFADGEDGKSRNPRLRVSPMQKKYGKRIRVADEHNIPSGPTREIDEEDDTAQAPPPPAADKSGSGSSSDGNRTFVKEYASVDQMGDTPNFGATVRPIPTEWIWNLQGITFSALATFVEGIVGFRLTGACAGDWAWEALAADPAHPLPGASLGILSEQYANTWMAPFLRCVMCPSGHAAQCLVPVVVHLPTKTAWMTPVDAAQYVGRSWGTLMSNLPAALCSTRLCKSEEPFFRLGGAPARGILAVLKERDPSGASWGLTDVDSGEGTVIGMPALVCTSTAFAEIIKTLTPRMLPRKA